MQKKKRKEEGKKQSHDGEGGKQKTPWRAAAAIFGEIFPSFTELCFYSAIKAARAHSDQ